MSDIRQEKAQSLTRLIESFASAHGTHVLSKLPLGDREPFRFSVLEVDRDRILRQLHSWGYLPKFVGSSPTGPFPGSKELLIYEAPIPDMPPVPDDYAVPPAEGAQREVLAYKKLRLT